MVQKSVLIRSIREIRFQKGVVASTSNRTSDMAKMAKQTLEWQYWRTDSTD